ncbi:hypothetical protein QDX23_04950 [Auritidibacter ignavus]|uniref:hypothetical protein n=2 Tax=Auritidibacter ignavus TaxID=678932 RepID=UPI00244CE9AB|nr:hypothetical protein [Auritidibacter ignavus]WGH87082.1 hypothetical protein QDX24_04605 [Auritidibacter ignavus]WGH89366.1 hypothetical protein QDX22_04600 [Auritidibacter ignavus]WGH91710.1 hypothetical protein QDX23_04950 [Auritidibacter ignavus]WHS27550.1 hypothetical protein QM395_09225 [Auritidibacter ignavus]
MKQPRTPATLTALALTLALTGCSDQAESEDPTPTAAAASEPANEEPMNTVRTYPTDADYYFIGDDGRSVGKFTIPTEPTEEINHIFTSLIPDEESTFIKVTVDNREGESQFTVDDITGYDTDGKEYKYQDFGATMSGPLWSVWEDIDISDDAAMQEYDELEALVDKYDNDIEPGAIKDVWLISQETSLPDELTRLGINGGSSYMGGTDALPVEMAEFDLDFEAPTN